jgi:hypothetical protein
MSGEGGCTPGRVREVLLRYGWLLPFYWSLTEGAASVGDVARKLGVNRRVASTGLYYLARTGVARRRDDGLYELACSGDVEVRRSGRLYASIIGDVVVVAKVRGRSVKTYTVPLRDVEKPPERGKRGYRARVARIALGLDPEAAKAD